MSFFLAISPKDTQLSSVLSIQIIENTSFAFINIFILQTN